MSKNEAPLLSVVIPTFKRPEFLSRAISSALHSAPDGRVEVIVVPNGPDKSWTAIADSFSKDPRVKWCPISVSHANAARNHGLALARAPFIRFLDDDDYLYPESCLLQFEKLVSANAHACSGSIDIVVEGGSQIGMQLQPETADFVSAALCPERLTHPGAHLFRRSAVVQVRWDEERSVRQDTDWIMRAGADQDWNWVRVMEPVAAWVQHSGVRVSRGRDPGAKALRETAETIMSVVARLEETGRLTECRKIAAADGLWGCLQKGLRYDFHYWRSVAQYANSLAERRRPPSAIYRNRFVKHLNPLWVESMLIPARWIYHPIRLLLEKREVTGANQA